MSGGVDSAVAAARARDAGHEVTGIHLALTPGVDGSGCCTPSDARDARRAADVLGLPYYVWDLAERFASEVIDPFLASYAAGRTPNPCMTCNERIKFAAVLDRALALGFDGVVTGHHARLSAGVLRRSVDPAKDQSYVLGTLQPDQLRHSIFPLGSSTKAEVRDEARARGLAVADKPDSTDVCFTGRGGTAGWLRARLGEQPGPLVDATTGSVVGEHRGAYAFTLGQRRGLGGGSAQPRYVLGIEPTTRTVTVGPREMLRTREIHTLTGTYDGPARDCDVQLSAHGRPLPARVTPAATGLLVELAERATAPAPGQAVVLYEPDARRGDRVLGGARVA